MMTDTYRNFIEIMSLKAKIYKLLGNVQSQTKRILDTENKKTSSIAKKEALSLELLELGVSKNELLIKDLDLKLSKLNSDINKVNSEKELNSINSEISFLKEKLQALEDETFLKIDIADNLQAEITTLSGFITGIDQTITEIKNEAEAEIQKDQKEISNLNLRILSLVDSLPTSVQKTYHLVDKKFKTSPPFSFINQKNCSTCKINIDQMTVSNVLSHRSVEICPSCDRILLPNDLNIY
jgi:predicted  nucleic acid-binding Zn-ribbon protein